jgi:selenide,water dikinase
MGPGDLKQSLCKLTSNNDNVLVGFDTNDDSAVFKLSDDLALVQTLDFITPVVDDPYLYGKIAAANSLSDIFAMGAEVKTALNIVGFDAANLPKEAFGEILRGGEEKVKECGGALVGGHTIEAIEMFYGLSVTGVIDPKKIYRNNAAQIGDALVLTKPLGFGMLTTAIKRDLLNKQEIQEVVRILESLNYKSSQLLKRYKVSSCTDITGFGLLGHCFECCRDDISFFIDSNAVPIVQKARELGKDNIYPGGTGKNMKYLEDKVTMNEANQENYKLFCDAQTSGGLLIAMDKNDAKEYIKELEEISFGYANIIGEVIPRKNTPVILQ